MDKAPERVIPVVAMRRVYYQPSLRPKLGKLYEVGEKFECEESQFSDYDTETKTKKGQVIRGCMRRLDKVEEVAKPAGKKG